MPKTVTRYVLTYINKDGMRTLMQAAQGRKTHATHEEALRALDAVRANNAESTLRQLFGPDTYEVRPCECWAGHFDPVGVWFDD